MFELLVALVLFGVSVFADRVLQRDTLAQWLFGLSGFALFICIEFFLLDVFVGEPPYQIGLVDFFRWLASELGGWSLSLAYLYFVGAGVAGIMFLLARFVDAVEAWWYGYGFLICLLNGIVFMVGFFVFFEAVALILGIIATIIGIIVGIAKILR